jgi:hypothetical protein
MNTLSNEIKIDFNSCYITAKEISEQNSEAGSSVITNQKRSVFGKKKNKKLGKLRILEKGQQLQQLLNDSHPILQFRTFPNRTP